MVVSILSSFILITVRPNLMKLTNQEDLIFKKQKKIKKCKKSIQKRKLWVFEYNFIVSPETEIKTQCFSFENTNILLHRVIYTEFYIKKCHNQYQKVNKTKPKSLTINQSGVKRERIRENRKRGKNTKILNIYNIASEWEVVCLSLNRIIIINLTRIMELTLKYY